MLRAAATAVRSVSLKPIHPLSGVYAECNSIKAPTVLVTTNLEVLANL